MSSDSDFQFDKHEYTRLEDLAEDRPERVVAGIIGRLPSIWLNRRKAQKIVKGLREYRGDVELPDNDTIYKWIEELCSTPHRRPGTVNGHRAEKWVAAKLQELGLTDVGMDAIPITVWQAEAWSLKVNGEALSSFFVVNTGFTKEDGERAHLVYVGTGRPKGFEGKDVRDRIVVADVPFPIMPTGMLMKVIRGCYALSDPDGQLKPWSRQYLNYVRSNFLGGTTADNAPVADVYWRAHKLGAKGICLILRDQPGNSNTHYGPYDGIMKPMPGLWIGKNDGKKLRELAKSGAEASLVLRGSAGIGKMHNVWGVLPGKSDDVILVTSHHDSPFQGAVEDGCGVAQVLAQAWAWSRVPMEQRPKSIVFVVDAGHFYGSLGAHMFAREHAEIMNRAQALITLEHLAAKEVEECGESYKDTGRQALTVMFTSPKPRLIATVMKALEKKPPKICAAIPADLLGPAPTSDASGYVIESGVPVISWIGCPYYLLDEHDTLDKIDRSQLRPIAETVTELIKLQMMIR